MPRIARSLSILATVLAACLLPAAAASAKPHPKQQAHTAAVTRWAAKHHLKGAWRTKDSDSDGLANLKEYKLKTDPKRADTDRDGLKDGDEITVGTDPLDPDSDGDGIKDGAAHPGVVTAFDGAAITIRQFNGRPLTASLDGDTDCGDDAAATDDTDDDWTPADDAASAGDDPDATDDDTADDDGSDAADSVDVTDNALCDPALKVGAVITSAEVDSQDDGTLYLVSIQLTNPTD